MADVVRESQHPPGYPLAVLAASAAVRAASSAPLADQMVLSTQLVSCVAGVLLVFPTYRLGRMLYGPFAGTAAALLFQVLPVAARITSDGLTEGLYLLGLAVALTTGVRAVRTWEIGHFLQSGLAAGLTYLVRPEGLLAAAAVGAVVVWLGVIHTRSRRTAVARLTALAVGVMVLAGPYMAMIGGVTNKPAGQGIIEKVINIRQLLWNKPTAGGSVLFAAWEQGDDRVGWVLLTLGKETAKAFHYAPLGLAAVGFALAVRRRREQPHGLVLVAFAGLTLALLTALALKSGYLSERHTLPFVWVGIVVGCGAIEPICRRVGGWLAHPLAPATVVGVLVLSCLPATVKPLHENRAGHKFAGQFLAEHAADTDVIIDPFEWAQFYAGRAIYEVRRDPSAAKVRWAVLEKGSGVDNAHSRLPRLGAALNVANDGANKATVEYHWPPDVPVEAAKVLVYKQQVR